jgi:hypothetical protein
VPDTTTVLKGWALGASICGTPFPYTNGASTACRSPFASANTRKSHAAS